MSQEFLLGISTAMIIAFIAIITIYLYYYRIERKQYLLYWTIGWLFFCTKIIFLVHVTIFEKNTFFSFGYDICGIMSVSFILFGTVKYFRQRIHHFLYVIPYIAFVWYIVATITHWSFITHYLIPILIISFMYMYLGTVFWKNAQIHRIAKFIGILFYLMGIHQIDYLILRQVDLFVPFGYLIQQVLLIFTAIGFAIIVNATLRNQLSESENRFSALANTSRDLIYSIDLNGNIMSVNKRFQQLFSKEHPFKKHISTFFPKTTFRWDDVIHNIASSGIIFQNESTVEIDGEEKFHQVTLSPIFDKDGKIVAINGIHHDMTNFKEKDRMIEKMAFKDILTGLPNSYALYEHLNEKIYKNGNDSFAVLYIGLDQFKKINDLSGPTIGDELLKMIGKALELQIGKAGFASRYGGDEFVIVTNSGEKSEVEHILSLIRKLFQTRWILRHQTFHLSASIGISIFPKDGKTAEELLKNANMTLHYAKEMGKNRTLFYNAELREKREKNNILEKALYHALENNEFRLYFQPQIHVKTNRLRGFEALIRWENPSVGIISPNEFIPLSEKRGLIVPIGDWVINEACRVLSMLHHQYGEKYCISINISPKQIQQDDFVDKLKKVINQWKVPVNYLELEITETVLIDSFDETIEKLNQIHDLGIRLSLDDFGTGYSSFNYLTQLPIHLLKIDKSFVRDIHVDLERAIFLEKLIDLVKQFKLDVLVEGVELKEQVEILKGWNCDFIQGYCTAKPFPLNEMLTYIEKYA